MDNDFTRRIVEAERLCRLLKLDTARADRRILAVMQGARMLSASGLAGMAEGDDTAPGFGCPAVSKTLHLDYWYGSTTLAYVDSSHVIAGVSRGDYVGYHSPTFTGRDLDAGDACGARSTGPGFVWFHVAPSSGTADIEVAIGGACLAAFGAPGGFSNFYPQVYISRAVPAPAFPSGAGATIVNPGANKTGNVLSCSPLYVRWAINPAAPDGTGGQSPSRSAADYLFPPGKDIVTLYG